MPEVKNMPITVTENSAKIKNEKTVFYSPVLKNIISALSVLILGAAFDTINDGYFTSILIYSLPMTLECFKFNHSNKILNFFRALEIIVSVTVLFIAVLGVFGILKMVNNNGVAHIIVSDGYVIFSNSKLLKAKWFWVLTLVEFGLSIVRTFGEKPKIEEDIEEE